jgi:hypothetical protein
MTSQDVISGDIASRGVASQGMASPSMASRDVFSTFAKEGGRVGSGALGWGSPRAKPGGGQGGVGRCAR